MIFRSKFYSTSSDFVYLELRAQIVKKQLKPGERLPEMRLAEDMGVSRTPVREALRKLANEGLVRIIPNSGARVAAPTASEVHGAYTVREYLESLSVNLACRNGIDRRTVERMEEVLSIEEETFTKKDLEANIEANNMFHRLIAEAGKNAVLREYIDNIILRTNVYVLFFDPFIEQENCNSAEHRAILRAIAVRDADLADKLIKEHLRRSHSVLTAPQEQSVIRARLS